LFELEWGDRSKIDYFKVMDAKQKDELGTIAVNMIEHAFDINLDVTWFGMKLIHIANSGMIAKVFHPK
jgi:hypothetical protein